VTAPGLAVRAALVAVAAAAIVWLALGLRASRLEARAVKLATGAKPTPALIATSRDLLRRARANNADTRPVLLEGELYIFAHRPRQALGPLLEVVRREPENFEAWRLLAGAARAAGARDLAARARARALVLSPPARGAP
jgi:predicted Zn-dependent protease